MRHSFFMTCNYNTCFNKYFVLRLIYFFVTEIESAMYIIGNSFGANDRSTTGLLKTSTAVIRTMNQDAFEMLEYPFITMQQYPPGFILHIGKHFII